MKTSKIQQPLQSTPPPHEIKSKKPSWFRSFVVKQLYFLKNLLGFTKKTSLVVRNTGKIFGEGASGQVKQVEVNREMAAHKIIRHNAIPTKQEKQENNILIALDHPHIISTLNRTKTGGVVSVEEQELDKNF